MNKEKGPSAHNNHEVPGRATTNHQQIGAVPMSHNQPSTTSTAERNLCLAAEIDRSMQRIREDVRDMFPEEVA